MARVLVFERNTRWFPELRRQLADVRVRIQSVSTSSQVRSELNGLTSSQTEAVNVVLIDLEVGAGTVLALVAAYAQRLDVRLAIVGYPEMQALEPALRELGADSFPVLPVSGQQLAAECLRLTGTDFAM